MVPPSTELLPSAAPSSVHHFVATPLVDSLQQQGATIGGHAAAVKASAHLAAALIGQIDCDTVCAHGVCLWLVPNLMNTNRLLQIHTSCSRPW